MLLLKCLELCSNTDTASPLRGNYGSLLPGCCSDAHLKRRPSTPPSSYLLFSTFLRQAFNEELLSSENLYRLKSKNRPVSVIVINTQTYPQCLSFSEFNADLLPFTFLLTSLSWLVSSRQLELSWIQKQLVVGLV